VVVANPPYMGGKGMNGPLSNYLAQRYPDGKFDLMTAFITRAVSLTRKAGFSASITLDGWMFLTSCEKFRKKLLHHNRISSLVHIGWNTFPEGHLYNRGVAFIISKTTGKEKGQFFDLSNVPATIGKNDLFLERVSSGAFQYAVGREALDAIPGSPIAYWASEEVISAYRENDKLSDTYKPVQGLITGNMDKFSRLWHEVNDERRGKLEDDALRSTRVEHRWFPYNKGGSYRKWYGNFEYVVDWEGDGQRLKNYKNDKGKLLSRPQNEKTYFQAGLTWTAISSSYFAVRYSPRGAIGSNAGMMVFSHSGTSDDLMGLCGLMNSSLATHLMRCLSESFNFDQGVISKIPVMHSALANDLAVKRMVEWSKSDWDAYETSWDFTTLPLLSPDHRGETLADSYATLRAHWQSMTDEMQALEEENNRIFIDAYGLQDELTPEVPLEEIT
ncbi:MAG: hypothetical protein KDD60_11910, partial [Bdellovibrionales bacterium]|nr:hypothetical protein [Bdellovibrionales bacterium]